MYEYHGWITLRETPGEDETPPGGARAEDLGRVVGGLRALVERQDSPYLCDLRWMNGEPFVHLGGLSNHAGPTAAALEELFAWVAAHAPGSYG
ncbi:hypothetical protein G3I76_64120, partial [Streptomyces sp. SID11233]|nr:hypothetical protein [Streptomyces sp. SID11233]